MEPVRVACIAPALTDETLAKYRETINGVEERTELRDILETLYKCVTEWWNVPVSSAKEVEAVTGTDLTVGPKVKLQKLDVGTIMHLWEHVPWMHELLAYEKILEEITDKTLRDTTFHLLWHAKEITLDREPVTMDRIVTE